MVVALDAAGFANGKIQRVATHDFPCLKCFATYCRDRPLGEGMTNADISIDRLRAAELIRMRINVWKYLRQSSKKGLSGPKAEQKEDKKADLMPAFNCSVLKSRADDS